uniref:Uncharacterized protein n=1 Tax=Micrurus paraensis TaxID=1970185 RepID=A0A2D4KWQ0_9SAUR
MEATVITRPTCAQKIMELCLLCFISDPNRKFCGWGQLQADFKTAMWTFPVDVVALMLPREASLALTCFVKDFLLLLQLSFAHLRGLGDDPNNFRFFGSCSVKKHETFPI